MWLLTVGHPRLEVWLACVCQCLAVVETCFWFWGLRVCIAVTVLVVGLVSQLLAPQAVAQDPWRFWRRRQACVPSQGLKVGQGVSQKHLVLPCPGDPRGQLVVRSQGMLRAKASCLSEVTLHTLGAGRGSAPATQCPVGFNRTPFCLPRAAGSQVGTSSCLWPLLPRSHSLPWKSRLVLHACGMSRGLLPFLPLPLVVCSLAGRACTVTRMVMDPSKLLLRLQGLTGTW